MKKYMLAVTIAAVVALSQTTPTMAQQTIKIGDLNSYNRFSAVSIPYRNGLNLAIDEFNAAGGAQGRKVEIISQDDGGVPADAVRAADELVSRRNVDFMVGGFLSPVAFALADFAKQKKILYIVSQAASDNLTMAQGNRYTFRNRSSTYMVVKVLAKEAAKTGKKKWAIIAPNYEYGQAAAENFKIQMKELVPGFEVVAEQYPPLGKIDAGATIEAIQSAKPEAIFNVLFGADLVKLVREGGPRGLFENRSVVSYETGQPEWLDILKEDAPKGWIVNGYPWYSIKDPAHQKFVSDYQAKYKDYPRHGSFIGYVMGQLVGEMLKKAPDTKTDTLIKTLEGLSVTTPVGKMTMRAEDHQLTYGTYMGKLDVKDGRGVMIDTTYYDGADVMIPLSEVAKSRPKD
ncbi:ABC transporter substrate-binding protein [Pseudorhodoplanes sp.]|uniref:ABC transporter substrate-binding protein n=1 Tax=Pseudorhodoplanes sp. TaxID=1934341 RepID=UPI003D1179B9